MEGREATQTIATLGGFFQRPLPRPGEPGVMLQCTLLWQEETEASKWGQFSYALPALVIQTTQRQEFLSQPSKTRKPSDIFDV